MTSLRDAIDYRRIYLEEKRKARERNIEQRPKDSSDTCQVIRRSNFPQHLPQWHSSSDSLQVPMLDRQVDCVSFNDPATIYYRDTFLPATFCNHLWTWLEELPSTTDAKTQQSGHWHTLPYAKRKVAVFDASFPQSIQLVVQALIKAGVFDESAPPNHILINHYTPFQGIMPHTDGPAYLSRTATLSLGDGQVLLHFEPRQKGAFTQ